MSRSREEINQEYTTLCAQIGDNVFNIKKAKEQAQAYVDKLNAKIEADCKKIVSLQKELVSNPIAAAPEPSPTQAEASTESSPEVASV